MQCAFAKLVMDKADVRIFAPSKKATYTRISFNESGDIKVQIVPYIQHAAQYEYVIDSCTVTAGGEKATALWNRYRSALVPYESHDLYKVIMQRKPEKLDLFDGQGDKLDLDLQKFVTHGGSFQRLIFAILFGSERQSSPSESVLPLEQRLRALVDIFRLDLNDEMFHSWNGRQTLLQYTAGHENIFSAESISALLALGVKLKKKEENTPENLLAYAKYLREKEIDLGDDSDASALEDDEVRELEEKRKEICDAIVEFTGKKKLPKNNHVNKRCNMRYC